MPKKAKPSGIAADQLRSLIERIERLQEERADLAADISAIYAEAKANGFDAKTMRSVIKLRALTQDDRNTHDIMLALYRRAVGIPKQGDLFEGAEPEPAAKPAAKRKAKNGGAEAHAPV